MKKIILPFLFILISFSAFTQNNKNLDPYDILLKVLNYDKWGTSKNLIFSGGSRVGLARGESFFDFSNSKKSFPNVIVTYTVFLPGKVLKEREGGRLDNLKFSNTEGGGYKTKSIIGDWVNFDKGYGSGKFNLSIDGEQNPNIIEINISGNGFIYFIKIEVEESDKFQELVNILTISGKPIDVANANKSYEILKAEKELKIERDFENEKKEKELIANAQKLKEYNAKEGIISNLNVGESHWRTTCIFRSEDKKYSIVSNNWELQSAPYKTILYNLSAIGKEWKLPNLREAKILQKNNEKFNFRYSFKNLLIIDKDSFFTLDSKNQIYQIDINNDINYDYLFLKYYGDTSQLKKSRQNIIDEFNIISNLSVGEVKDNYFVIENSSIKNALVMLTNCPVISTDKIEEKLKELGDEWRIPNYYEALFIDNIVKSNKKIKKLIPYGGFGIFEFSNYYSYNFNSNFRNYNNINELETYGRRINNPTGVYSSGNEAGLIRFCPIKTFY
jgi:hypothetical protein